MPSASLARKMMKLKNALHSAFFTVLARIGQRVLDRRLHHAAAHAKRLAHQHHHQCPQQADQPDDVGIRPVQRGLAPDRRQPKQLV